MRNLLVLLFSMAGVCAFAQAPQNYYSAAEGKKDAALKTALYEIMGGPKVTSYKGLWTAFKTTDSRADGKVWDIYSNTTNYVFGTDQCGNYGSEGDCYNREHSFPKSWFSDASPMYSDLYHLYPSDGYVNGRRSNYPFGEVGSISWSSNNQFSKLGSCDFPGYTGTVFEPNDQYKGDLARTYFYMVTAYENRITGWSSPHLNNTKYPAFNNWSIELLLKWHRQDPVDQKEIERNNDINYGYQSNRNPFIDYPELAEHIWGNKKGVAWETTPSTDPTLINPSHGSTVDFGNVPYLLTSSFTITVRAIHLTGDLYVSLTTSNSAFSIPIGFISKTDAENGYKLPVSIYPQTTGEQQATLTISGGGISVSTIHLKANSTTQFLALPATNIDTNAFKANWTSSDGASSYLLNVYSYEYSGTASQIILEEDFNQNGTPNGWTKTGYTDNYESGSIRLASSNDKGEIITPALDLSAPTTLLVVAKSWNGDNADLYVSVNGTLFTTLALTNSYQEYETELPAFAGTPNISFSADKSKRLFIDKVTISTEGESETPVSLPGYPKNVGNVLNYLVTGLMPDSTYYYTVTPQGNGALISDEIQVITVDQTKTNNNYDLLEFVVYMAGDRLYVSNLDGASSLLIYSVLGNIIAECPVKSGQANLYFNQKGVFILQAMQGNRVMAGRKIVLP